MPLSKSSQQSVSTDKQASHAMPAVNLATTVDVKFEPIPNDVAPPLGYPQSTADKLEKLKNFKKPEKAASATESADKKEDKRFESAEHEAIGNLGFMSFYENCLKKDEKLLNSLKTQGLLVDPAKLPPTQLVKDPQYYQLKIGNKILSPGRVVCLAGDFYGPKPVNKPISRGKTFEEKEEIFQNGYWQLKDADEKQLQALQARMDFVNKEVKAAIKQGKKPSLALAQLGMTSNKVYAKIMATSKFTFLPFPLFHSEYLELAKYNFDHFGDEALAAYEAGHRVALKTAKRAHDNDEKDEEKKARYFIEAIAQELFALHYLTDKFAAGHMRTPRLELYDYVMSKGWTPGKLAIAGLLAKEMHDEENAKGLMVHEKDNPKNKWHAFGDDCAFNPESDDNRKVVCLAVQAALEDIYHAYNTGELRKTATKYIPTVSDDKANPTPLFKVEKNKVDNKDVTKIFVRGDVNNPYDKGHNPDPHWSPVRVIVARYMHRYKPASTPVTAAESTLTDQQKAALESELQMLHDAPDSDSHGVECKLM